MTQSLAVAWTISSTDLATRPILIAQTTSTDFVSGEAVILNQSLVKIGSHESLTWLFVNPLRHGRNVRNVAFVIMAMGMVERFWQVRGRWQHLIRKEKMFCHHSWSVFDGIVNVATESIRFGTVLGQSTNVQLMKVWVVMRF